ncbi:methionine-tRNA synthetase [Pseudovirgaria hyperparasitica]|uniref:Probable methionine--tRNA ligase, mitochondrial n=1 Tax=Pseudovirgaria hyperparasitica TaxID=470096 RepID=A0A6A6W993_9PEZI|nr:methionine-tRNA synthetase [Pseudovirgaria hyperparasitica]KAF2759233.1 methionine-tRNA synthetase [Pseudovirgaria hyperparasitica]
MFDVVCLVSEHSIASTASDDRPVYITTPIFYVNAAPHIGHMYTMILGDIMKRWHTLCGKRAILCTGTDEHGMKIQQAAALAGIKSKSFCDDGAQLFKNLASECNVEYDRFIRTTDKDHIEAVQYAWSMLADRGYLYESKHEGWYAVSDETFYPTSQVHSVLDTATGKTKNVSKETGKEVQWVSEINYRFRLSAFRERLLEWYKDNPRWILPDVRMQDIVRGVEAGTDTEDLSVSRPCARLTWGIPVPTDSSQTIYVWLDALINYITAAGFPWTPGQESIGGWPAHCQIIGKDIMRFHCIYWPAFLMALDIPLPKQFLTHGYWLLGKERMSKSTGNVINPFFALDRFGVDNLRCFLALHGNVTKDSSYSNYAIYDTYQTILRNRIGNLVSRLLKGKWSIRRAVMETTEKHSQNREYVDMRAHIKKARDIASQMMANNDVNQALQAIIELPLHANAFIQQTEPWMLVKKKSNEENAKGLNKPLDITIFHAVESIRVLGILLQPFMPGKARQLLDMLGVSEEKRTLAHCEFGCDRTYGESPDIPEGEAGMLFPPLASTE